MSQYGDRYEYGVQILVFAVAATLAVGGLTLVGWLTRKEPDEARRDDGRRRQRAAPLRARHRRHRASSRSSPASRSGRRRRTALAPVIGRWAWLGPTLIMLAGFAGVAWLFLRTSPRRARILLWLVGAVAVVWTGFILDKVLVELSPHWAQKHVIAAYYDQRKGPEEPLIAWQLYWRGENFYTRNEIYDHNKPQTEKTIFLGDRNVEKMQTYFKTHGGRRVFFIVERVRFEALRNLLPVEARPTLKVVDSTQQQALPGDGAARRVSSARDPFGASRARCPLAPSPARRGTAAPRRRR